MASQDHRPSPFSSSPLLLVPLLLALLMGFATLTWLGARREMAALYGMIRSVEFPFINRLVPYAEMFSMDTLRAGQVPGFTAIYLNSLVYGLFFTALTLLVLMLALARLDRFSIMPDVTIKADKGRTPAEVMERLALDEPSVRFFLDYPVLDLPTNEGTARQPLRALELLLYTDVITHVVVDPHGATPPDLEIDADRLRAWMTQRFGPANPFMTIPTRRLLDVQDIHRAVDSLSWYAALVLYPALQRVHAFHVEDQAGYKTAQAAVDSFIDETWTELNKLKLEFGPGIALGYASEADREERNALYRSRTPKRGKGAPVSPEAATYQGSTTLDNLTDLARVHRRGRIDRGEIEADAQVARSLAGPTPSKSAKSPENLLFFGEVVSERGPGLAVVAKARDGLKLILTRHLGLQTGLYPVAADPKTGLVTYAPRLANAEQKAFNTRAQERLARAQAAIERVLFHHQFEFSVAGGAVELARNYGILPPNLWRWMRFCDETASFWWFIQNLGMPAAYPENAGLYEHYQAERAIGLAVELPHLHTFVEGLRTEAVRYLVPERVDELKTVLGRDVILSKIVGAAMPDLVGELGRIAQQQAKAAAEARQTTAATAQTRPPTSIRREGIVRDEPAPREVASRSSILDQFDLGDD